MRRFAQKTIFKVQLYVPGRPIEEVKRELGLKDVIKLASNENPWGPSPKAVAAIMKEARQVNRYPDGDCFYLRQALAKRLQVSPRQLVFGNGSDEIIVLAARTFIRPGDEVIIAKPSFLIYDIAATIAGARVKAVPLKNFRYDLEGMKKAVSKKTRIIFLGNPDNPSGQYFTQKQVERFLDGLRRDILIFIDEAYHEYVQAPDYVDAIGLLKRHKNILATRTFSKMYGLAGLRVGYGIGDEETVDCLNRVREPFNVNSLAQAAALACLNDRPYYQKLAVEIERQRKAIYAGLGKLGVKYIESCTNFVLMDMRQDASRIVRALLAKGVIVRDMRAWGLERFIRVTIGTAVENERFLNALKEIL
ncbi:MAG: histidinol-phosphate transaminase [Candidatus Omnitrophica bacterium]|nr:histidinol-phosphate transaminase [Candidatus Omnitrophota bacterium]